MKKVLAIALSIGVIGSVAAQPRYTDNNSNRNNNYSGHEAPKQNDYRNNNRNVVVYKQKDNHYDYHRMSDRERQQEIARINQDYDRRVTVYRNDRRMNARDRDYQIQVVEKERSSKLKAFGGGLLLGGIIGAILSH